MTDFRSLEVFYWVVQLGGFRRAAAKLNTTQPAVSSRITALEAAMGGALLDRGRRRALALTPRGTELLGYAGRMLALQGELQAAMGGPDAARGLGGTVRLGVSETVVHTWLSNLIRRVREVHPLVTVDIAVDISSSLRAALLAGEMDAAILLGPVLSPRLRTLPLCGYPLAWVARPGLLPGPRPVPLADLLAHPVLTYARGTAPHDGLAALCSRPGLPAARIFSNSSLASIVRMALDGIGVGLIAPAAIARELVAGDLEVIQDEPAVPPLVFEACWADAPGSSLCAAVARLAQEVANEATADIQR